MKKQLFFISSNFTPLLSIINRKKVWAFLLRFLLPALTCCQASCISPSSLSAVTEWKHHKSMHQFTPIAGICVCACACACRPLELCRRCTAGSSWWQVNRASGTRVPPLSAGSAGSGRSGCWSVERCRAGRRSCGSGCLSGGGPLPCPSGRGRGIREDVNFNSSFEEFVQRCQILA